MNGFQNLINKVTNFVKSLYGADPGVFVYAALIAFIGLSLIQM